MFFKFIKNIFRALSIVSQLNVLCCMLLLLSWHQLVKYQ